MAYIKIAAAVGTIFFASAVFADEIGFKDPWDSTSPEAQENSAANSLHLFVEAQHKIDDNLFRLPSAADSVPPGGLIVALADHQNIVSAGVDAQRSWNAQTLKLDAQIDENRFERNSDFNGLTGKGKLEWDWNAGPLLTGKLGTTLTRFIPSFQDTLFYGPNFFTSFEYFAETQLQPSPHWTATAGVNRVKNSNSNAALTGDDFVTTAASAGLHYFTLAEDWIGIDYLHDKGAFNATQSPQQVFNDRDFHDDSARLATELSLSSKWRLNADVGYLHHATPGSDFATFSGDVWRASLRWQPLTKSQITAAGWRDITAYLDAQSAFFVSTGYSLTPQWTPRDKITLSLKALHETHVFLGTGSNSLQPIASFLSRQDKLTEGEVGLSYRPRTPVLLKMSYAYQHRSSNLVQYSFNDNLIGLSATLTY